MRYFFLFITLGISTAAATQNQFSTWFSLNDDHSQSGLAVATDGDSTIFINTAFFCYRPEEEEQNFSCSATIRTDMSGELLSIDTTEYSLHIGRSESFFWHDSLLYSTAYVLNVERDSQMLVRAMTADLEVVHHNNLDSGVPNEDISFFAPYGEDGFVATAFKWNDPCDDCDTARVVFLDRALEITHEFSVRQDGPLPDMYGMDNLVLPDGTLVGADLGCGLAALCGAVTRFDTAGNILWQNFLDQAAEHSEAYVPKLAALPDGNFVVTWIDTRGPIPIIVNQLTTFLGMNTVGDTLWTLALDHDEKKSINVTDIHALNNGDVLGIGRKLILDADHPKELLIFDRCGYLCRISPTGELLWERVICDDTGVGQGMSGQFYDVVETVDGDLILSGKIKIPEMADSTRTTSGVWLVRTDSLGCVTPGCGEYDVLNSTREARAWAAAEWLDIWPNPARDRLEMQLDAAAGSGAYRWRVQDATGRLVHTASVERGTRATVDVAAWPPGLYTWQLLRDGLTVQTGRQVKL